MSGLWHIHCMFFHVGDTRKGAFTTILIFTWKLYSYILSLLQCIEWHGRRGGENLKAGDKLSDSAWPPRTSLNTTACPLSNILDIQVYPAFKTKFKRRTFLWERCWTDRIITGAGTQCTCKECLSPCRRYLGKQGRSVAHFGVRLETLSLLQNKLDLAVKCYLGAVLVKMTIAKESH